MSTLDYSSRARARTLSEIGWALQADFIAKAPVELDGQSYAMGETFGTLLRYRDQKWLLDQGHIAVHDPHAIAPGTVEPDWSDETDEQARVAVLEVAYAEALECLRSGSGIAALVARLQTLTEDPTLSPVVAAVVAEHVQAADRCRVDEPVDEGTAAHRADSDQRQPHLD